MSPTKFRQTISTYQHFCAARPRKKPETFIHLREGATMRRPL